MSWFRRLAVALLVAVAAVTVLGVVTGTVSAVSTEGNSMGPRIEQGDAVLVRGPSSYAVGDSAAYWSDELDTTVLHRIVAIEDGKYTFQGDNNSWLDPETPTEDELIGKEVLHIPHGGVWLDRLTSPTALGLLTFGLLATGGTAVSRRRRLRRRTMAQHAAPTVRRSSPSLGGLPSWATTTAAAAGIAGVLGVTLGAFAWTSSAAPIEPAAASTSDANQSMTFSYTAEVPRSPAYDDTTVTAPQPVFRNLTDDVVVQYTYTGDPGTVTVTAQLSTASGWSSTVPLAPPQTFTRDEFRGKVVLDLDALEKRALAAAEVTGIPVSQVDVKVVPTVSTKHDKPFNPELALTVTPLQLTLAGDRSSLTFGETANAQASSATPATAPTLSFAGREVPVETARILSLAMVVAALLAAGFVGLLARRSASAPESETIQRRYAQMLVPVEPISAPAGRPVIDVVDFPTLAKLAQRYELLIMHWSRSDVETFVVQDQGTTYRYRTGTPSGQSSGQHVTAQSDERTPEVV